MLRVRVYPGPLHTPPHGSNMRRALSRGFAHLRAVSRAEKFKLSSRLLEPDHRLVRPGPAEFFARETFQGARIVLDSFNLPVELTGDAPFFGDVGVEFENVFAVAFVLLNERQIPEEDGQQPRDEEEKNHHSGEFVPNPKIDVHCKELSTRRARTKRRNCKMWRLPLDDQSDISGMYVDCSQSDATPFRDPT